MCTRKMVSNGILLLITFLWYQFVPSICDIPQVTFEDFERVLNHNLGLESFQDEGGKYGAFIVTRVPPAPDYARALERLKIAAPECIGKRESLPISHLSDGSTRRTFATEGDLEYPKCISKEMATLSQSFNEVESLVVKLLSKIVGKPLSYTEEGGDSQNLLEAPHKDHIHVYERVHDQEPHSKHRHIMGDFLVPYHIDNGLFLLLSPFPGHGLRVRLSNGNEEDTDITGSDSVIVLFGRGATEWLLQAESSDLRDKIFPVPHAVPTMAKSNFQFRFERIAPVALIAFINSFILDPFLLE